jgi:hypothetical protein
MEEYLERKKRIVSELRKINEISKRYNQPLVSDEFIRGFVIGATIDWKIPASDYDEILREVRGE